LLIAEHIGFGLRQTIAVIPELQREVETTNVATFGPGLGGIFIEKQICRRAICCG
jgi:hypothetical protein